MIPFTRPARSGPQKNAVKLCGLIFLLVFAVTARHPSARADTARPAENDRPTTVRVGISILNVEKIDEASQSFRASVYYEARWKDARLAHAGLSDIVRPLDEVWHPRLVITNQQRAFNTLPRIVHISPDGEVAYRQRVWGSFSQSLVLRSFPFDRQRFEVRLAAAGCSPEELELVVDKNLTGLASEFSQPNWKILREPKVKNAPYHPGDLGAPMPSVVIQIQAERKVEYYLLKIIFPLILIVAMSWVVFWIDPQQSGTQIGVAMTSMLTLIAYRFMTNGMLPDISYLTRMDVFVFGSTMLVFATLVQVIATSWMAKNGKLEQAVFIDGWCRGVFPLVFACISIIAFL